MAKTLEEELASVEKAIEKAEEAQEYSVSGRSAVRAQLQTLYAERRRLKREIYDKDNGSRTRARWG